MNEATKTRKVWEAAAAAGDFDVLRLLRGDGIDIGCGPDPVLPGVEPFDQPQGDANRIGEFVRKKYDFVFSSHALEHMHDPPSALRGWFSLVKPGGHLVCLVPDEDLYEQGCFPSLFNRDHKHTFTLAKGRSWSPRSINVLDLVRGLEGAELVQAALQDHGYDRRLLRHRPGALSRFLFKTTLAARRLDPTGGLLWKSWRRLTISLGGVTDQTAFDDLRLAQIQFVVRRTS